MKRRPGSRGTISAGTEENAETIEDLVAFQDSEPGTHKSQREIAEELGISV